MTIRPTHYGDDTSERVRRSLAAAASAVDVPEPPAVADLLTPLAPHRISERKRLPARWLLGVAAAAALIGGAVYSAAPNIDVHVAPSGRPGAAPAPTSNVPANPARNVPEGRGIGPDKVEITAPAGRRSPQALRNLVTVAAAEEKEIARCMAARGFTYTPLVTVDTPPPTEPPNAGAQRYNLLSDPLPADPVSPLLATNRRHYDQLSKERQRQYGAALTGGENASRSPSGFATGSCIYQARVAVYGPSEGSAEGDQQLLKLEPDVGDRVVRDPAWLAAQSRWSTCMRKRGVNVATVKQLFDELSSSELKSAFPHHRTCTVDSGLWSVTATVQTHYAAQVRREKATALAAAERRQQESLTRARRILGQKEP